MDEKHSSGDLHSRLKTRKLLGVGETDDGDVHRSKLSQILGHSDQLYVRLPPGLKIWQLVLALIFTVIALWAFIFPSHLYETTFGDTSLSLVFWFMVKAVDKELIRLLLLCSIIYFTLHTIVSAICVPLSTSFCAIPLLLLCTRLVAICISSYFYWIMTRDWRPKDQWKLYRTQQ
ncbi:unnamed protein product [Mytilus edulis]|uniref:Tumor protein p53-inducible protein 11 n=1 Tax=Mytilus edulis TaxID=6550 RepID=A0A8S3QKA5_MYTED|nr:unnamed protein product [Mytilus edulis]